MPLKPGTKLRQRYRIEGVLGQGGMGAVYRAFDINLGVDVAVKENLFTTAEYARQFELEAKILASLRHPNLPRVTDHFVIEGEGQYLVMDYIQGVDLRERLERDGSVSENEAVPWFLQICDALGFLHSRVPPILHRDIKPGNIKIMPDDRAMLVDFGLAKVVEKGGTTTTGAKAMTPGFSPPEQYGTGRTDPRTDVYSLGATMYAALTAAIPEDAIEQAMGREKLTPIRRRNPEVSRKVARVIEKALQVEPRDRYQSIAEMAKAIHEAVGSSVPTDLHENQTFQRTVVAGGPRSVTRRAQRVPEPIRPRQRMPLVALLVTAFLLIGFGSMYLAAPELLRNIINPSGSTPTESLPTSPTDGSVDASPLPQPTATSGFTIIQPTDTQQAPSEPSPTPFVDPQGETVTPTMQPPSTPMGGGVGQIAYVSEKTGKPQIYLINVDGTGERWLTNLPEGACQPAWSPDGSRLIFTSPCQGNREDYPGSSLWLISVDLEGNVSDPEPLPSAPGGDYDPAWAPDGQSIAFSSLRTGRPQIHVMGLDGGNLRNMNDDLARNRQPTWSPTGEQLLFTSTRGELQAIWIMPVRGGDEAHQFSRSETREDSNADWSRDGQVILFVRRKSSAPPNLVAVRFDEVERVESKLCYDGRLAGLPMAEPSWSPDGKWIVLETWPDGSNHDIAIITSSCSQYVELTSDPSLDFDAAWRPLQ
jgi:serine/threonine protein kinase